MRVIQLLLLSLFSSTILAQKPLVEATCPPQTIASYTSAMDQGAHAIHIEVVLDSGQFKIASGESLSNAIKAIEWHTKSYTRYEVKYILNLQKSNVQQNESKTLYELVDSYIPMDRVTIRSADIKLLKQWNKNYPYIKLAIVSNAKKSIDTNLANLGIKPSYYSIESKLLTESISNNLHKRDLEVTSYIVNDTTNMRQMMDWKVDRIITDSLQLSKLLEINREVKDGTN